MSATNDDSLVEHLTRISRWMQDCRLLRFPRESRALRQDLAKFMRESVDAVVEKWLATIGVAFGIPDADRPGVREWMCAATLRWIRHIEDPADVETYRYLRDHARGGFISRFPASRFLAGQMKVRQLFRAALIDKWGETDPDRTRDLVMLLDQEFQERVLHITDFFVEARIEELHAQEASYRQLIEDAPAAIFQIDADDGTVIYANRGAERVTGFKKAELVGRKVWQLHPVDEQERAKRYWVATRETGAGTNGELHLVSRDGGSIPIHINSGLIEYGKQRYVQRICVDLSERRRLENQLVQSEKMAAIGQLAAGVAHEIRNPLGAIRNALYDLKEILADGPAEAREDVRIAEEELVRAKAIIDSLLEFSRVSNADQEPVHLNDVLEKTLLLMNKYLKNSDVQVETDFGAVPACLANENEMRQVVLNLITNAVQAMPNGGRLSLRTAQANGANGRNRRIVLEVRDSGVGIPPEHLSDIFNPFFTTKAPGQGTGLGLSVVDSIVRRSQGEIRVESRVGVGTTFHLEFPCDCAEGEEA